MEIKSENVFKAYSGLGKFWKKCNFVDHYKAKIWHSGVAY